MTRSNLTYLYAEVNGSVERKAEKERLVKKSRWIMWIREARLEKRHRVISLLGIGSVGEASIKQKRLFINSRSLEELTDKGRKSRPFFLRNMIGSQRPVRRLLNVNGGSAGDKEPEDPSDDV